MENAFRQPGEWEPHSAVWTAFPSHGDLWLDALDAARAEHAAMCRAIADVDPATARPRGERLRVMAYGAESVAAARRMLDGLDADIFAGDFGDIWFRDTAPLFVFDAAGRQRAHCFLFNGWGGKYILEGDEDVCAQVIVRAGLDSHQYEWILEGGSVESDGQGTCLTTRQCLLNPNRNPGLTQEEAETRLREALGYKKVLWLDEGLANDHTDGHIDNLARFVAPGVVACPAPSGSDDPNRDLYERVAQTLETLSDAAGRRLEVVRIPSPGLILTADGEAAPASHMNFYISNTRVIVPTYEERHAAAAIDALKPLFPSREVVPVRANNILLGGGSFHCITQNQWR